MRRDLILVILFIFLYSIVLNGADPVLRTGEMRINFIPQFILLANTPVSGWQVTSEGMDKVFSKNSSAERKFRFTNGEYMFFDWWFIPFNKFKLNIGYELTMDYADTFYHPINIEHKIHNDYFSELSEEELAGGIDLKKLGKRLKLWHGKAEYRNNFLSVRLYKGYGHAGWDYSGDIFGFYPEQWDVDSYRRIGGKSAPAVLESDFNLRFGRHNYGNFSFAAGPEPIWGNGWSYYGKYTYKYRFWIPTLLFKYETIKWGKVEDEKIWALALTTKYYGLIYMPLEFGIVFNPFRVNEEYTVTHSVELQDGYGDSGYYISTGKTSYFDALGAKIKGNIPIIPFINKLDFSLEYLGKTAGNKYEINVGVEKKVKNIYSFYFMNSFRMPVEGPEVLILEGDEEHPGQPITSPRGRDDPFWVNSKNRTAFISSLTIVFDPTPGSWIFQYRPYILEEWNLNQFETSPYAFLFNYRLSYYPGTTDLEPYISSTGEYLWPGEYDENADRMPAVNLAGCWKLKRPIHFFTLINEFKVLENGILFLIFNAGEKIATSSMAYTESSYELIPFTRMFSSKVRLIKYPFEAVFEYGHNVFGPENWYELLGGVVDNMYKFEFKFNLNKYNKVSLAYVGYRENDNKYFEPKLGVFDEFRLEYKAKLGVRFSVVPKKKNYDEEDSEDITNIIEEEQKDNQSKQKTSESKSKEETLDDILND